MIYLTLDENNYLLSVASVGGGVEVDIDLSNYDLTGDRINAHKWNGEALIFDAERYAEIEQEANEAEPAPEPEPSAEELLDILLGVTE